MIKILILAIYAVASTAAATEIKAGLAHCLATNEDAARLACYDELARAVTLPALPDSGLGAWQVQQEISPIDDSHNVYMSLAAKNVVDANGSGKLTRPTLGVRCMENKAEVFINYYAPLESSKDYIPVLTRFDQNQAQNYYWILSTNKESIFAPNILQGLLSTGEFNPQDPLGLGEVAPLSPYWLKEVAGSQKLFVRLMPTGVSALFDLTGSAEAMLPLREACRR